jgi:putative nucleotidyltransferase with HDIG domain/PAS domain S-box-containing protein
VPPDPNSQYAFALLSALTCGAAMIDPSGKFVYANHRLCTMLQRNCEAVVGQTIFNLLKPPPPVQLLEDIASEVNEPRDHEAALLLPDGAHLPVMITATTLPALPGLSEHRLITVVDVSPQKEIEESLRSQYTIVTELSNTILEQAMDLKHSNDALENRVRQRTQELHEANLDAIFMLAIASEAKDQDTGRHVRRIQHLAELLARELGSDPKSAEAIGYAAVLHDVGKMHVPDHILQKPGPLTPEERSVMQEHTLIGERILVEKPFFTRARRIARSHHENWDGSGYPDGARRDEIPIEARIVHLADVYDALTSVRVYKPAWDPESAAEAIAEGKDQMFDPEIVRAFDSLYKRGAFHNGDQRT